MLRAAFIFLGTFSFALAPGPERDRPPGPGGTPATSCVTSECHGSYAEAEHVHAPVAEGVCKICHRLQDADRHEFSLARDGRGLCGFCHREIEADANAHNQLLGADCIVCHDPHGTDHPSMLPTASSARLCAGCHSDLLEGKDILHTPVATGPCTACHDPHAGVSGPSPAGDSSLCLPCHPAVRDAMETAAYVHGPLSLGHCDPCHDPHGSDDAANLRADAPALCYPCHEAIRDTVETAAHPHAPAGAPGGCLTCHAPHASSTRHLLRSDPLTVCGGCHADELTTGDGRTIAAVAREIETATSLHGPVRQRDCGTCHASHGSEHPGLLTEHYTPKFYARFDPGHYSLCFSCHPERKVLTESTTRLTDFRNGDRNLHYAHVAEPSNGRTCRACHATHGSNTPKHVRDWVKYGSWQLPVGFTKTATGGRCDSGCHPSRAYDRLTPVDYQAPAGSADKGGAPRRETPRRPAADPERPDRK